MERQKCINMDSELLPAHTRLPAEMLRYVDKRARRRLTSRSNIIREMLADHFRNQGLAAADEMDEDAP